MYLAACAGACAREVAACMRARVRVCRPRADACADGLQHYICIIYIYSHRQLRLRGGIVGGHGLQFLAQEATVSQMSSM